MDVYSLVALDLRPVRPAAPMDAAAEDHYYARCAALPRVRFAGSVAVILSAVLVCTGLLLL